MKHFFLLSFLLSIGYVNAQITVTNSIFPQAGDVLISSRDLGFDTTMTVTAGSASAQSWDFSDLTTSFVNRDSIAAASSGAAFADFPNTDILRPLLGFGTSYVDVTTTDMSAQGAGLEVFTISVIAPFSDPQVIQTAPLNYNSSTTDTYALTFAEHIDSVPFLRQLIDSINPLPVSPDSIRIKINGTTTMLVDAFGTCTIYDGSYDVLRQRVEEQRNISVEVWVPFVLWQDVTGLLGGFLPFPTNETTVRYDHWAEGEKVPIVRLTMDSTSNTVQQVEFKGDNPTSVFNIEKSLEEVQLFPNPAQQSFTLDLQGIEVEDYSVSIVDISGRSLMQINELNGKMQSINIETLPQGFYFVLLHDKQGQLRARTSLSKK